MHRTNGDVPEEIITGLAEIGAFGLSVPEEYGGFATGGESDYLGMVVATEELSRGSLGIGGSLITRPEILTRALVKGGTEEQKQRLAAEARDGEVMVAVAVTEPDFGSDVAGIKATATPATARRRAGLDDQRRQDVVHVRRPAPMCSCSWPAPIPTAPRRTAASRSSSCPSRAAKATASSSRSRRRGGKMEGRPIDTIGYRGMHSYEVAFDGLVGAGRLPDRRRRRPRPRLLPARWRASRTAACRPPRAPSA